MAAMFACGRERVKPFVKVLDAVYFSASVPAAKRYGVGRQLTRRVP